MLTEEYDLIHMENFELKKVVEKGDNKYVADFLYDIVFTESLSSIRKQFGGIASSKEAMILKLALGDFNKGDKRKQRAKIILTRSSDSDWVIEE